MLVQVKHNKLGFNRVFITRGRGRVNTIQGRAGGLINMDEGKYYINEAKELTTLAHVAENTGGW